MDILWTDDDGADEQIKNIAKIQGFEKISENLAQFRRDGFTIIEGAVPHDAIDRYMRDFEAAARSDQTINVSYGRDVYPIAGQDLRKPLLKILDTHVKLPSALALTFARDIVGFLRILFCEDPLAFQSLHFEVGSTQAMHQDTAYVVTDKPNKLVATWIALEDIQPGSGELVYYPGSHRFGPFMYPGGRRHWSPVEDGEDIHNHHLHWIHQAAQEAGVKPVRFTPKKGDVLFWHADLAHGGGEITDSAATRRSLVVHYTGASIDPYYFRDLPSNHPRRMKVPQGYVSSMYYDVQV